MPTKKQNHYEVLGLWRDASEADIRRAFRHLAMLHHPDVNSDPRAGERFRAIKEAYDVLSEPDSRAGYDATLAVDTSTRAQASSDRSSGIPSGWTPPWVRDWNAEAWLRANAAPAPWSMRALGAEMRKSWRKLARYLGALALVISACAFLDWAIPELGVIVVAGVFTLPFFVYPYLVYRFLGGERKPSLFSLRRSERGFRANASAAASERARDRS